MTPPQDPLPPTPLSSPDATPRRRVQPAGAHGKPPSAPVKRLGSRLAQVAPALASLSPAAHRGQAWSSPDARGADLETGLAPLGAPGTVDREALARAFDELVPTACRKDTRRSDTALETLIEQGVSPHELEDLVARGRSRDAWRAVVTAELTYALSFGAATATVQALADQPALDADRYGPAAAELVAGHNFAALYLLAGGIIGAGGEVAQAIVREGKMGPRYNALVDDSSAQRTPFADTQAGANVQRLSALPFGALYAADDAARHFLKTQPGLRLVVGAGAAALSALYKLRGAPWSGARQDPTWLDASTPAKKQVMVDAIQDLRQGSWQASLGYVSNHLAPGVRASAGELLSEKGAVRAVTRLAAASVARAGSVLMAATGMASDLRAQIASEAWLGLSWGTLSTWPQRLLDGAALGRAKEAGAPVVTREQAQAIAPSPKGAQPPGAA